MKITTVKNENGATVYHVADHHLDCIQEFWTYKGAQEYMAYVFSLTYNGGKQHETLEQV